MITIRSQGHHINFDLAQESGYWSTHQCIHTVCFTLFMSCHHVLLTSSSTRWQETWQFMSTHIPSIPGKIYELCNDLELHFFVIFYIVLHFIKQHNRSPKINMEDIFDQSHICQLTGQHSDSMGKENMYGKPFPVEFTSEPFKKLIHSLFLFFAFWYILNITMQYKSKHLSIFSLGHLESTDYLLIKNFFATFFSKF